MTGGHIADGCQSESLRVELSAPPLFTHACHCLVCRRRSGTAFALTSIVLRDDRAVTHGELSAKQISHRTTLCRSIIPDSFSRAPTYESRASVRGLWCSPAFHSSRQTTTSKPHGRAMGLLA
jgi:hypothetical protein